MADSREAAAILRRALEYPYATPERSYLFRDGEARQLPADPDLTGRVPLLAYGANASPEALARKLGPLPGTDLPAMRAELEDFDVVYSAHVSPYGAVPATLIESPGTTAPVFVLHPTVEQHAALTASEPNYHLVEVNGIAAYRSKHGCLELEGSPVALAAIRAGGRRVPELDEPAILDRVRARVEPDADVETFVRRCVERGGIGPLPRLGPL